ncbi:ribonuclease HI [Devosia sp. WQ 349]|uniref:ribonuclease H family protein n=1 Tax=Devosia sp. WQ 349K1 TaxID=2800329 RepID=UPI001906392D|nr:ribonuclease H [Devosia sp. WQ 349K1]MBK1792915.1 ribonuclease HI [Devosia sp. WQ 349K1]
MTASTNQQALPKEHHKIIGYTLATNGKCVENYGTGAWGAVIIANSEHGSWVLDELAGTQDETTCNRIKMAPVIEALKAVRKHPNFEHDCTIEVQSDSKNLVQGASDWIHNWKRNGWRNANKKPVKNREMWEELDNATEGLTIRYTWISAAESEMHQQTALRLSEYGLKAIGPARAFCSQFQSLS